MADSFEDRLISAVADFCCDYEAGQFVPADLDAIDAGFAHYGLRVIDRPKKHAAAYFWLGVEADRG